MARTYTVYLKNTQIKPYTGGILYDLSNIQGTNNTLTSGTVTTTEYVVVFGFHLQVPIITSSDFQTSISINTFVGTAPSLRWRLQRVNSQNSLQASSNYSTTFNTTGVKTQLLNFSTTWQIGDFLRLSVELNRGSKLSSSVRLNVNSLDSYVQYTTDYRRIFIIS